ncbi:MAG: methyltransferase family protein [Candidatus Acidiferrales bacterium]
MTFRPDALAEFAVFIVAACWLGFGVILAIGNRGAAKASRKRDAISHLGFFLQCCGYAICFLFHRAYFSPLFPMSKVMEGTISALAIAIALASESFCFVAARALGRQWSLVARVIEGHDLIDRGPYAVVRNPIYLAMFGMLVATGLAVSRWHALLAAIVVFLAGNSIRIQSEERLLREAFGLRFDEYAHRVPAFFPRFL